MLDRAVVEFGKDYLPYKKGRRATFTRARAEELVKLGVGEIVEVPGPAQQAEAPVEVGLYSVTFDKIWSNYYPGDVAGFLPHVAEALVARGAAHWTRDEDLAAFYDKNRGLAPRKGPAVP